MHSKFVMSPLSLTLGSFGSMALLLGTLRADRTTSVEVSAPQLETLFPGLPPEIQSAEGVYEVNQTAIESQLAVVRSESLALATPEARREVVTQWMAENNSILEAQAQASRDIDSLYEELAVTPFARLRALLDANAPLPSEDLASVPSQYHKRALALLDLRAQHADDPEARRLALVNWSAADAATSLESASPSVEESPSPPDGESQELSQDALVSASSGFSESEESTPSAAPLSAPRQQLLAAEAVHHELISSIPLPRSSGFSSVAVAEAAVEARRQAAVAVPVLPPDAMAALREEVASETAAKYLSRLQLLTLPTTSAFPQ